MLLVRHMFGVRNTKAFTYINVQAQFFYDIYVRIVAIIHPPRALAALPDDGDVDCR